MLMLDGTGGSWCSSPPPLARTRSHTAITAMTTPYSRAATVSSHFKSLLYLRGMKRDEFVEPSPGFP